MAHNDPGPDSGLANPTTKDKKASEPLFGPSIGSVSCGPAWTIASEKKVIRDELTPDTIASWIEKSKDTSQPTTTLQALVNLKRPTLRLSPLHAVVDDPASVDHDHHGLEFEYDCDAPKCGIYVHVFLPKTHPDVPPTSSHYPLCRVLVYENVVDGGFGSRLKLEDGATLELGRFENPKANRPVTGDNAPGVGDSSSADPSSSGVDVNASNGALDTTNVPAPSTANNSHNGTTGTNGNNNANTPAARNARRRFTHFHFRKRAQNAGAVSGPALAVVDAEPASDNGGNGKKDGKDDMDEGVRVSIRLAALDEQGCELVSPNEQITYLHIVRFGQKPEALVGSAAGAAKEDVNGASAGSSSSEVPAVEDTRPWVVRVVKREATIGPHTFQLQEIFGLSSTSVHPAPPTAPPPSANHTYPPAEEGTAPNSNGAGIADEEDPQSECLLCLSSPREVVLLPCRHLVACKECALNMVEFGAGGTITQSGPEVQVGGGDDAGSGANGAAGAASGVATPNPATTANPRRKRKAKGWFCPVCRQPYTSMLRITTAAPPSPEHKDGDGSASEDETGGLSATVPPITSTSSGADNTNTDSAAGTRPGTGNSSGGGGLLGGALRPGFLRGLTLTRSSGPGPTPGQNDVESQAGLARVGA